MLAVCGCAAYNPVADFTSFAASNTDSLPDKGLEPDAQSDVHAVASLLFLCPAGAINSLAAGLTRLANTATTNMVSNVNSMKSSLASFKALPGFPLADSALGGNFLSFPGSSASVADEGGDRTGDLYSLGTGSVELTRRLQQQWQEQGGVLREGSNGGLKQVHVMLQDDRQQGRASLEQQQQQQEEAGGPARSPVRTQVGKVPGFTQPPAAATQFAAAAVGTAEADAAQPPVPLPQQQQQQQQGSPNAAANPVPRWQTGCSSSSKPGGPKLVSRGPAAANIMIFPKHDDVSIITGIQEAWAGLRPREGAAAAEGGSVDSREGHKAAAAVAAGSNHGDPGGSSSSSAGGDQVVAKQSVPEPQPASAATASQPYSRHMNGHSRSRSSSGRSSVSPFGIEQQPALSAAAGGAAGNAVEGTSSMKRSTSEPSLQQWASDGLQGLGEPSWVKLGRSSDGASRSGSGASGQQQRQGSGDSGSGGAGGVVDDSTVHALESDLKKTARLYPPGRYASNC